MRKILLLLMPIVFITGCMNYVELSEIEIVENLGIDYINDEYVIIATTKEKDEKSINTEVLNAKGKSIDEAILNIKITENKKLYITHLNLLVITPNIIKEKQDEIISYFLKNTDSRNDFFISLAKSLDFFNKKQEGIYDIIKITEKDLGTTKIQDFESYLRANLDNTSTYLPTITYNNEEIKVEGITIIQNNGQIITLNKDETILYNFITNNINKTTLEQTNVLSNQTTIRFKNEKINIMINSSIANDNNNYSTLLKEKITKMFNKYKDKNIDIFNFKEIIEKIRPSFYKKNKNNILDKITLEFKITKKQESEIKIR